jgi:quercetin dioxygenase-like cupin family protein
VSTKQRTIFIALAIAAGVLTGVASREAIGAAGSDPRPFMTRSTEVFSNLLACEIPNLQERVLSRGAHSVVYAGEFTPGPLPQLTTASSRIYLYVISGTGSVRIGDMTANAERGGFFVIPTHVPHTVHAIGGPLRAIYFEDR